MFSLRSHVGVLTAATVLCLSHGQLSNSSIGCDSSSVLVGANGVCVACPQGGNCSSSSVTLDSLRARAGYWHDAHTLSFLECRQAQHCIGGGGGGGGDGGDSVCQTGRSGPLCSLCDEGYETRFPEDVCVRHKHESAARMVSLLVTLSTVLLVLSVLVARSPRRCSASALISHTLRRRSLLSTGQQQNKTLDSQYDEEEEDDVRAATSSHSSGVQWGLKSGMSFVQSIAVLGLSCSRARLPSALRWLSLLSVSPLVPLLFGSRVDHLDQLLFIIGIPPLWTILTLVVYVLPSLLCAFGARERRRCKGTFTTLNLWGAFVLYPGVCLSAAQVLVCERIGNISFLVADISVECYTSRWWSFAVLSAFVLLIWGLGVPIVLFVLLYSHRDSISRSSTYNSFAFLYQGYASSSYYFEMVDITYKFCIACLICTVPAPMQIQLSMLLALSYAVALLLIRPFQYSFDDLCHFSFLLAFALVLVASAADSGDAAYMLFLYISLAALALHLNFNWRRKMQRLAARSESDKADANRVVEGASTARETVNTFGKNPLFVSLEDSRLLSRYTSDSAGAGAQHANEVLAARMPQRRQL